MSCCIEKLIVRALVAVLVFTSTDAIATPESVYCDVPTPVSTWTIETSVGTMLVYDDMVVMKPSSRDVVILDYTDPSNPVEVGIIADTASAGIYKVDETTLMVFDEFYDRTRVLDVSDVLNPIALASFGYYGDPLYTRDHVMYVEGTEELLSYGFIGEGAGELLGTTPMDRDPGVVLADENIGFVYAGGYLHTMDFTDPEQPVLLNDGIVVYNGVRNLRRYGHYLLCSSDGLKVFDIADPMNPDLVYSERGSHSIEDIAIVDDLAYTVDRWYGLRVTNISNPEAPELVGLGQADSIVTRLVVGSDFALVSNYSTIFAFMRDELSSPVIDRVDEIFETRESTAHDGVQYVAAELEGLFVYDMRGANGIAQLGHYDLPGGVWSVLAADGLLYAQTNAGLKVFDVQEPEQLVQIGSYGLLNSSRIVLKHGDDLFVVRGFGDDTELIILDVSDPSRPRRVATYYADETIESIARFGDFIYLSLQREGVEIVDYRNPFSPVFAGFFQDDRASSLVVMNEHLVTASDLIRVFALDDPASPVLVTEYETGTVYPMVFRATSEDELLVTYRIFGHILSGIGVYDMRDPVHPVTRVQYPMYDRLIGLHFVGSNIGATFFKDGVGLINADRSCVACVADFNDDGETNFFDVSAFLFVYLELDQRADLNADGEFNFYDVSAFLEAYAIGCP